MILISAPILHSKRAFDANLDTVFTFQHSGNQVFKNRLIVRNNLNNQVVYDQIITSFQMQHPLPHSSLANGNLYSANIAVFDKDNVESPVSNTIVFYCFTTPAWSFTNLTQNQIIRNSSYNLSLSYSQPEDEQLNSWQVLLYDSRRQQLSSSGVIYQTDDLVYTITNLEDNNNYFVRAIGETINGMEISTEYIAISAEYINPSMFAIINLENQPDQGNIKIQSNIISIIGTSNPDPPIFIDETMVDLTGNGAWVRFEEGFSISDDFTLQILCKSLNINRTILEMSNGESKIFVEYRLGTFDGKRRTYLALTATNGLLNYVINSDYLPQSRHDDIVNIWIRRVGGLYDIKFKNMSSLNTHGDLNRFTYNQLNMFTHTQLKNSVLP